MTKRSVHKDITDYVARGRAAVTIPGAEPVFVNVGPAAFLILHGWCASAESVRFLTAGLAEVGYSVLAPTLPGHGTTATDMLRFGPSDWIAAAREAAQLLGRTHHTVYVLGVSMGGSLALQLAALEPEIIKATVTVNAPVFLANPELARTFMAGSAEELLPGWETPQFVGPPEPEICYPARSRKSGIDLYAMTGLANDLLPAVTSPLLVLQSTKDQIVPKENADAIVLRAKSQVKKVVWLDRSRHSSQLDLDRERIVLEIARFVSQTNSAHSQDNELTC